MKPSLVVKVRGHIRRLPIGPMRRDRNEGLENTRAWRAMIDEVAADDSARHLRLALMRARLNSDDDQGSH